MPGESDASLATISFEQKSSAGAQQALPPATLNSVTSVPSLCHGAPASKSRPTRFPSVSPTSPL